VDLLGRCFKRDSNPDGLYEITELGTMRTGFLKRIRRALFGLKHSDGVRIVHASGVGGGSLVYSNVTIRPPEPLFATRPWREVTWTANDRDGYYELARNSIGYGVLAALDRRATSPTPAGPVNTGLSNIVARSGGVLPSLPSAATPRSDIMQLPAGK